MKNPILHVAALALLAYGLYNACLLATSPKRFMASQWTFKGTIPRFHELSRDADVRALRRFGAIGVCILLVIAGSIVRVLLRQT